MTDIYLPTLAGLARLTRIMVISNYPNTGANPRNIEYACPSGRIAIITAISFQPRGGTAYSRVGFDTRIGGGGTSTPVFMRATPAVFSTAEWNGALWLHQTDDIRSAPDGGGATSDYRVLVSGVEFDYLDVS